ncbi:MAG TPA: HU family DNA-binding protein [Aquifex aeolicus]|uniref:HU family DNA-binding protein n=1 Tax=Aquifex aeolicus TaxID=63363 RepID=A0A9D0YNR6_AQUAO|nr:HU family DNA-binding protein [Aquificales bacterium]HIP86066.1 HU family DNA-binding protein [Aquifex sp.]HIP97947.1 HU family DNA-binding protein [Aquifex aeolicus]HIQ26176.1 HU family DNA-binding protein [Aquifex aeolicus]
MTKAELIARAAEKAGVSKKQADRCLKAFLETITDALQKGEKIALPGFGIFQVKERSERKGRNPRTKEIITIPARKVVTFKPAKRLKELIK